MSVFEESMASTWVDGVLTTEISDKWGTGGPAPNGGYLLALIARALGETLPHPHPLTITAHYLSVVKPGPATIAIETLREGRSQTNATARLLQDGQERIHVLAAYGDLTTLPDDVHTTAKPPIMPPPEGCYVAPEEFKQVVTLLNNVDQRIDPATAGWTAGEPSGNGLIRGWFRLADGTEPDPLAVLFATDAFPPTAFEMNLTGWVPTLELTVHLRAMPVPGWLRVVITTRNLAGGLLEEDVEIWDAADRLVAQARQLAKVRLPAQTG